MKEDWQEASLMDICRLVNGRAYSRNELLESGKYRVLRVGNFFTNNSWYYSNLELEPDKYCNPGDLLYAWSASFGPRIWQGERVIYHYHIWKVDYDKSKVDKQFLFYWFELDKEKVKLEQGAGTTMTHVSMTSMNQRTIPLPPLDEQKRIVAILDEAFAGIDKAIANTERNLANAKELFESYRNSLFAQETTNWDNRPLEELIRPETTITYGVVKPGPEGAVRFVRGGDLLDGKILIERLRTITTEVSKQYKRTLLKGGELLICLVGVPGQVGIVPPELVGANIARQVGYINLRDDINPKYVSYYLLSGLGKKALGAQTGGSVQQVINLNDLRQIAIPMPTLAAQTEIVNTLENISAQVDVLKMNYAKRKFELAELRQSILQKSFTGELTAKPSRVLAGVGA